MVQTTTASSQGHSPLKPDTSLDPADYSELKSLSHQILDGLFNYLETLRDRPLWQAPDRQIQAILKFDLPEKAQGQERVYHEFTNYILPRAMGNWHPRYWRGDIGNGTVVAALGEMLAAAMNLNSGAGNHAVIQIEEQVIDWFKQLFNFPADSSGLLVSDGAIASLTALHIARDAASSFNVRQQGLQNGKQRITVYASREVHPSIVKVVELLGMGRNALRLVETHDDFTINTHRLELMINTDIAMGYQPVAVIASTGTIRTGAIDDLDTLAALCERHHLWLHVAGGYGALAAIVPELQAYFKGLERADSISLDLHTWFHMPGSSSLLLVRNAAQHRQTFSGTRDYLTRNDQDITGDNQRFSDYGISDAHGFQALSLWMSMKAKGIDAFRQSIQQNVQLAHYLTHQIEATPGLELMTAPSLNVVCFRYNPGNLNDFSVNHLNKRLRKTLEERGIAALSTITIDGQIALRVTIINHRSHHSDLDFLLDQIQKYGAELAMNITQERQAIS